MRTITDDNVIVQFREFGLQSSATSDDTDFCAVCLERQCTVAAEGLLFLLLLLSFCHFKVFVY